MPESLDKAVIEDFAERIISSIKDKPKNSRFGMTHLIQFVRDSHKTQDECRRYKEIGVKVPKYIHAAVLLLIEREKAKEYAGEDKLDNWYSFIF